MIQHTDKSVIATIVSGIGSGLALLLEIIPADIGKLSALAAFVLAVYYIRVQQKIIAGKNISIAEKNVDLKIKMIALDNAEREAHKKRRADDIMTDDLRS